MNKRNPAIDAFLDRCQAWQKEMRTLRSIVLECELDEELKWGVPCYTFQNSNVVLIHAFKEYCALLFVKGALLKDQQGILVQQTSNVQSARQIRFTGVSEIVKLKAVLKAYIIEAVDVHIAGTKVEFKKVDEFDMPEEFRIKLAEIPALRQAFDALTPGRRKAYLLYFSAAKQSKTRVSRIEKCLPLICNGKGLKDI